MLRKIADLGQNIQFVAFWAHLGVAALLVEIFGVFSPVFAVESSILIVFLAAIKEFYFDAKYEQNPPQTFWNNVEDFGGWSVGTCVGLVMLLALR